MLAVSLGDPESIRLATSYGAQKPEIEVLIITKAQNVGLQTSVYGVPFCCKLLWFIYARNMSPGGISSHMVSTSERYLRKFLVHFL